MKYILIFLLCILPASLLLSQEEHPLWLISEHDLSRESSLKAVQAILDNGYELTGIDYNESFNALKMLFLLDPTEARKKWTLYEFTDPATLEEELSVALTEGFRPIDIAVSSSGLLVFFVEDPEVPNGWRIERSDDFADIERYTKVYSSIDYSLQGLAQDNTGMYWVLFVKYAETKTNTVFERVAENEIGKRLAYYLTSYAKMGQIVSKTNNRYLIAFNQKELLQEAEE